MEIEDHWRCVDQVRIVLQELFTVKGIRDRRVHSSDDRGINPFRVLGREHPAEKGREERSEQLGDTLSTRLSEWAEDQPESLHSFDLHRKGVCRADIAMQEWKSLSEPSVDEELEPLSP